MREGCNNTAGLQYNHAWGVEYTKTKHTRVDETEPLCHHDHDLQTYAGWSLVVGTGKRPMVPPDDPRHPKNRPKP
jgi:lysine/ornithine N-monooxygenase